MNPLTLAGLMVTSPSAAFGELRERPNFLAPLIALIVGATVTMLWYYSIVDFNWLKDHLFGNNPRFANMPEEQRERMLSMMSQKTMMSSGVITTAIAFPMVIALQAGYYWLAGRVANVKQTFLHWFSLVAWSTLPALIGTLATFVLLATSGANAQVGPADLQVLSLNNLLFQLEPGQKGYQFWSTLNLLSAWGWALCVVGVRTWSGKSWAFSAIFVMIPFAVIYGGWAFFALRG